MPVVAVDDAGVGPRAEDPGVVVVTDPEPVDPLECRRCSRAACSRVLVRHDDADATVAPVAARTAPRVSQRSRDVGPFPFARGVGRVSGGHWMGNLFVGTPPSDHRRLDTLAAPAVGLL